MRHCATCWKVARLILDGVGIFHSHNTFGFAVVIGSSQPLGKMSTSNNVREIKTVSARADNLTTLIYRFSWNMVASYFWTSRGLSRPVHGLLYLHHSNADYEEKVFISQ